MDRPVHTELPLKSTSADADAADAAGSAPAPGPHRAFVTQLFNKYRASLQRYLGRLVPSEDAAELAQEAFFRLLRHGELVRIEALARAFLFETGTNLARDLHRRRSSHKAAQHVPVDGLDVAEEHQRPEDFLAGEQVRDIIERTLAQLPQDTRTVFLLHRYRDLSYPQIATLMNMSARTVARKMAEAIERLSAAVGQAS
jgi:RNA polymerase sigma-70 factor (ECF subfamily)